MSERERVIFGEEADEPIPEAGRALHGRLYRRVTLLTALVAVVGILFGVMFGCFARDDMQLKAARQRAPELAQYLSAGDVIDAGTSGIGYYRMTVTDGENHAGNARLTADDGKALLEAFSGMPQSYDIKQDGRRYVRAITPVENDPGHMLVIDLPVDTMPVTAWPVTAGILAGLLFAAAAYLLLGRRLVSAPLKAYEARLEGVAAVAHSVAAGKLDKKADETGDDEPAMIAHELNGVTRQLSRSMYTLILERNRLQNMIDGLSEGIIAVDTHGEITHINPAISRMFAQTDIGANMPDARMCRVPEAQVWKDFDSVVAGGESVVRNFTYRDMTIRLTVTPIVDELDAVAGAVGLLSDITQSERLEKTRREYVSNVSHELRTPLTAVRALIEPLKEGMVRDEADRMRYYDIILREVMRLSRLINDQLELSRLQSGSVAIEKQRMTLDDLVYDVCDRFTGVAAEKGLALKLETDMNACPSVYSNADRVEELLIILVDNAIKYTEKGTVSVSATWDDELVRLSVRDTGIGIAEEDVPHVFDRFYKVDKAHSGKGSGLGLSIASELVTRMGETIDVRSKRGEGSTFSFTIHRK